MKAKPLTAADNFQDAINRLNRSYKRGTGCHLTAEMVFALGLKDGAEWDCPDPRYVKTEDDEIHENSRIDCE